MPISRSRATVRSNRVRRAARWSASGYFERLVVKVHPEPEDVELAVVERDPAGEGVDLDAGDQFELRGHRPAEHEVAVGGERVVVGDRERRDPGVGGRPDQLDRREDAVGPDRVRVEVDGGRPTPGRSALSPTRGMSGHAQTSTYRAIRSIARARPVAGSMSIWAALKTTAPSPDLEPRRQGVDEPRQDGLRVEADHAPHRPGHPEVGLVGRAARQDPLVARDHVGVRPDDGTYPPVEVQPERVLLGCQLAVEVDEADRRQRLRRLIEQRGRGP